MEHTKRPAQTQPCYPFLPLLSDRLLKRGLWFLVYGVFLLSTINYQPSTVLGAQETDLNKTEQLEASILANPKDSISLPKLEELSSLYLKGHQYNQMVDFLRKLEKTAVSGCELPVGYYIGLCRFNQLRYLEEAKNWPEYFDQGNLYREELLQGTAKTVSLCPGSPLAIKSQVINWLEHKAKNDSLSKDALDTLINLINNYVRQETAGNGLDLEVIKETADILRREEEPALAKAVYNLYVSRLIQVKSSKEKLRLSAESALENGNISLAEIIYERYIAGIKESSPKDDLAKELMMIAEHFSAAGSGKVKDMAYAEKIFTVLEDSCGAGYFSEELQYSRAYNFQRLKDYSRATEEYEKLVKNFPAGQHVDEAEFKLGIISTYIAGQKQRGISYWQKLYLRESSSLEYKVEGLYHKSLISQYEGNIEAANTGYDKILELIKDRPDFKNLSERVLEREKEIQTLKPIEYDLQTFLETALKQSLIDGGGLELLVKPAKAIISEEVTFSLQQPHLETGCLVPQLTYLWSGDLGSVLPVPAASEFTTTYGHAGTKVVNLVVLSGQEVIGAALEMAEVSNKQ